MDLTIFIVLLALSIILLFFGFYFRGGVGLTFAIIGAGFFVLMGLSLGSGVAVTDTTFFNSTDKVVEKVDFGISDSNLLIMFVLLGVAPLLLRIFA